MQLCFKCMYKVEFYQILLQHCIFVTMAHFRSLQHFFSIFLDRLRGLFIRNLGLAGRNNVNVAK